MAVIEPLNFEQPDNELSQIAEMQRKMLFPKNDFKKTANEYSSVNPDALADGDRDGKGTGEFLDVFNQQAGAIQDIQERNAGIVINEYKPNSPYTTPSA
ncbi:MAG: hypothetical protein EBS55_10505 [Flavobacteriaceae bacterium]|jgi:hypothetical protein|nr:hypothetical protein [Flavobacteriaceae bacterium]